MIKKILLVLISFFTLMPNSAIAVDSTNSQSANVILLKVTKSQAEKLELVIPKKTKPGYHIVTIQILDVKGIVSSHDVAFCKMPSGVINWNNKCPGMSSTTAPSSSGQTPGNSVGGKQSSLANLALIGLLALLIGAIFIVFRRRRDDEEEVNEIRQEQE